MKPILKKIEEYKQVIDSYRPLTVAEIKEYDNYLRIGLTYSSNAIEGNTQKPSFDTRTLYWYEYLNDDDFAAKRRMNHRRWGGYSEEYGG